MFVRNKTAFQAALAHGSLSDEGSVGALVVTVHYRLDQGRLVPCDAPDPLPTDPPDTAREPLWSGTSITAAGDVYGPAVAPYERHVTLSVGEVSRVLVISGERRWVPGITGELRSSAPERFDRVALSFSRAFGGSVEVPPGLFPGTGLPFPGGRLGYSLNPAGTGFYLDAAGASGQPLPSIELADQRVSAWSDRPVPGCFVPCPELPAIRLMTAASTRRDPRTREAMLDSLYRGMHHAPGYLVFDDVGPGTPVQLGGLGREPIRLEVPPPPVGVRLWRPRGLEGTRHRVRSVHVNADSATVSCVHGFSFTYRTDDAPSWVLVET